MEDEKEVGVYDQNFHKACLYIERRETCEDCQKYNSRKYKHIISNTNGWVKREA